MITETCSGRLALGGVDRLDRFRLNLDLFFVWRLVEHHQSERALVIQPGEHFVAVGIGLDWCGQRFRRVQSAGLGTFQHLG